ncbi:MAG: hypothetical protein KatS3mg116_2917 [Elioraea sp.]|nr:MAG: hypothetical protein KatS3mg116_2917 [Elioraea sp.]
MKNVRYVITTPEEADLLGDAEIARHPYQFHCNTGGIVADYKQMPIKRWIKAGAGSKQIGMPLVGNEICNRAQNNRAVANAEAPAHVRRASRRQEGRRVDPVVDQHGPVCRCPFLANELIDHGLGVADDCRHTLVQPPLEPTYDSRLVVQIDVEAASAHHATAYAGQDGKRRRKPVALRQDAVNDVRPLGKKVEQELERPRQDPECQHDTSGASTPRLDPRSDHANTLRLQLVRERAGAGKCEDREHTLGRCKPRHGSENVPFGSAYIEATDDDQNISPCTSQGRP